MVSLLQIDKLTKSFGELTLFKDISFGLYEGQKTGLIGRNGCGKSTLMNMIVGNESVDGGKITFKKGIRVAYLPQTPIYPADLPVLDACFGQASEVSDLIKRYEQCLSTPGNPGLEAILSQMDLLKAWDYERQIKQILTKLDITNFQQPIGQLSGGQLKRVALANALISAPELLIMDEPTNHLDIDMTEWLENYLKASRLSILMVTHDRYFLDSICTDIIEIDDKRIYQYKGNYAYYIEKRQERVENLNAEIRRANNLYRTELEWMRRMPQARGHKAKSRIDAFYDLEKTAKQRVQTSQVEMASNASYIGNKIFEAKHLFKRFGEKVILDDFSYTFSRYEKLGIIGDNGTGKSTFIKMLLGIQKPDKGIIEVGETVKFGYYSQEGLAFDEGMRVIDVVKKIADYVTLGDGSTLTASQLLQHFLFSPEKQYDYVAKLSGGERKRLYLCTILMGNPNFLILDEPTNDLDIVTLQILEEYLAGFKGCAIIISHDRYFMDKIVNHLFVFKGEGKIKDFPGNYTEYRNWEEERRALEQPAVKTPAGRDTRAPREKNANRMTYAERKEFETIEKNIAALEKEKADLENEISSGMLATDELIGKSQRIGEIIKAIDEKTERWLLLSEKEQ